ncbi:hypothetical protein [Rhodococcus maanshanensis]|uniref:Uncharacterized protein n=1 Tax=Rhodococcus maanshanensis TaxID=183556 RepID=A0A1H7LPD4_9NOCA|nr:hypothetical protein [Rhodococcus maanshanensis]SEL00247.1 hypothetical protein SAMN05444583_105100 [Rhodococcus maanshanensis]
MDTLVNSDALSRFRSARTSDFPPHDHFAAPYVGGPNQGGVMWLTSKAGMCPGSPTVVAYPYRRAL